MARNFYTQPTAKNRKEGSPIKLSRLILGGSLVSLMAVPILFCLWLPYVLLQSFVAHKLWDWFFVAHGLPEISLFEFLGLTMIIATMSHTASANINTDKPDKAKTVIRAISNIMKPFLLLGFGYVVKSFL